MPGTQVLPSIPSAGAAAAATFSGIFGDAADGDFTVVAAGSLTLNRERHYNNLTVQATGTVAPAGFKLCVAGAFTNAGTFSEDGQSATGGTAGTALAPTQYLRGTAGNGAAGRATTGTGANGTSTTGASYNNTGLTPAGGNGGAAGANAGGTGGTAGVATTRWASNLFQPRAVNGAVWNLGAGGAAGGATLNAGTATSGGGGAGGGAIWLAAKTINNAGGTISCKGGNGGNATVTVDAVAGGGGGGGGGLIGIITTTPVASIGGTITAAGGTGGTGAGGGGAGAAGNAGSVNYYIMS